LSRDQRTELIEREERELPLSIQAELLEISRASLYYRPLPARPEEVALKHRIDEIYTQWPFYGSRKVAVLLQREGQSVNRKAVQRHMREMGIAGICPGPSLSRRNREDSVYPYLLRNLKVERPDHVWGIDITYVRLTGGWVYLVAVLDWYSRYVVSWEIDQTLEIGFVLACVERALGMTTPEILNSDQGSHFTSEPYLEPLKTKGVRISMDGKGRALDNIFTERLWRSVKYEEVYLKSYETPRDARIGLNGYLNFYNTERPHQALGYRTPHEVYIESNRSISMKLTTETLLKRERSIT
jgi:putative transposase